MSTRPGREDLGGEAEAAPRIHATAEVEAGAVLGPGVKVWHHVHVCAGAEIGAGTVLGQNVYVGPGVRIGRGCRIQNNVSVYEGVTLEDEVFVGPSAVFTNVRTPRAHVSRRGAFDTTYIERRVTIGANATIVCGSRLAEGAFVAAGAVVTRSVTPYTLVAGVPARPIGHACACGEILQDDARTCAVCGRHYVSRDGGGLTLQESA